MEKPLDKKAEAKKENIREELRIIFKDNPEEIIQYLENKPWYEAMLLMD